MDRIEMITIMRLVYDAREESEGVLGDYLGCRGCHIYLYQELHKLNLMLYLKYFNIYIYNI